MQIKNGGEHFEARTRLNKLHVFAPRINSKEEALRVRRVVR